MQSKLGRFTLIVRNYEEATTFYVDKLGFEIITDQVSSRHRFVHLGCAGQFPVGLWLWEASQDELHLVGNQAGNHPLLVMYSEDCISDYYKWLDRGVRFLNEPVQTQTEIFVHAQDLYGNEIVLVEMINVTKSRKKRSRR